MKLQEYLAKKGEVLEEKDEINYDVAPQVVRTSDINNFKDEQTHEQNRSIFYTHNCNFILL